MPIAKDTWKLIEDAVKNKTLADVCEIYRTHYLEYKDVGGFNNSNLLHRSSRYGKLDIVRFCVEEKGLNVDIRDGNGDTALHKAVREGHLQVIQVLVSSGADVDMKNKFGNTALHWAAHEGHLQVVQHLLSSGADVNVKDNDGYTALHWAARKGNLQVLQHLLSSGADVNVKDNDGYTALHWAAREGHLQVVQHLLSSGADVNVKNNRGSTALHKAAGWGHLQVVICLAVHGADFTGLTIADVEKLLNNNWNEISLQEFDVLSDILNTATASKEDTRIEKVNADMNKKLAEIIETTPDFANDPKNSLLFYRGHFYKNLVEIYVRGETQNEKLDVTLLKTIYVALQSKISCDSNQSKDGEKNQAQGSENKKLEELLGENLRVRFENKIVQSYVEQVDFINENRDRSLIARKIHGEFIKTKNGCVKTIQSKLTDCWKETIKYCTSCTKCCLDKLCRCCMKSRKCKCQIPRLSHKCKTRGNFAVVACFLAVWVYMLDLVTDFTVGYEDYNGFSKKLGIFEMTLVVFTLMHENIRSSISLFETEEELLRIKLGKEVLEPRDWITSELVKNDSPFIQFLIMTFWPFAVRKKDGYLQCFKAVIYNLLTIFQLRPVVDRLRVLMHSPTNLRVIYRHRTEQDSLKQFYLITEQIPELLIQFYTLQIVFNIAGGAQSGDNQMFSDCGSGHNFSYPRFTDSLNNPDERNWFCNEIPINSLVCDIVFRLFSAMIPFFMIPSGIVSLEVGLRLLDAATPKMSTIVQYLLQAAYTLMIPARLLMFAALMHAVSIKEIIFGYVLLRVALELLSNRFSIGDLDRFFSTNVNKRLLEQENRSWVKKLKGSLSKLYNFSNTIWRISMFSVRDVFAVSIREPQAYMISPSNVTYKSIRQRNSLTKRCAIFLLEGLVGAWIIEEFYPCGRHSEIFRYIGWMCLASLLLSVTVMTLISDLLHPQHLLTDDKDVLKRLIRTAGLSVVFGIVSSLVFIITQQRTSTEKWVFFGIAVHVLTSGILILVIKFFAYPSEKKDKDIEDSAEMKASESAQSCYLGLCCPSLSFHKYSKVPGSTEDMVNESSHFQDARVAELSLNMMPSESIEMNTIETSKAMTMNPCHEETDLDNLRGTVHEKNTKVKISQQPLSYEIIPKQVSTEGTVLEQTSSDEEVPEQTCLNEEVPKQRFVGEEVPEQKSSNEEVLEQTSSNEEVREQTSSKDKAPEQTSSNEEVLEQISSKDKVPEQTSSKDKVPEQTSSNEEVREQISSKDKVPEQTSSKDKVPEQTSSIEEVREQASFKEKVREQTSSNEEVREQISSKDKIPEQTSSKDKVPEQTSSKDKVQEQTSSNEEVREQISSKDKVPEQTSSKDKVLEQPSSIDEVREQASFKGKVPEQTSSNEEVREQISSKDKIPEQTSSKDKVPEQTSSKSKVPEQTSSKDKVPEQTFSKDKVPEKTSSKDKVPEQTSSKSKVPEQTSSKDKVPEQTFSKDKVPEQTSSKDKVPEQTSSKDKVPGQTSLNDDIPELTVTSPLMTVNITLCGTSESTKADIVSDLILSDDDNKDAQC